MGSVIQIRVDEKLKNDATVVFENLGIDISTAVRMFLKKSVAVNGLPFDAKNEQRKIEVREAIKDMQNISKNNGNSNLSLKEINDLISATRNDK